MNYRTEAELVETVRSECHTSNWRLGELAALWVERWGSGKTDAAFCERVGGEALALTADRVGRCRRVWNDFGKIHGQYRGLKWSHFDKVRQLDPVNQTEVLVWAEENEATVSEMMAWARANFGEMPGEEREETREESGEPAVEDAEVKPVKGKAGAVVKAKGGDGAAVGDRVETRDECGEPEEEDHGEVEADHPMTLIGHSDAQPSTLSPQPSSERAVVANLIRCLKLEEQTLRRIWPTLTVEERKSVAAVLELLVEFLTLEAVG